MENATVERFASMGYETANLYHETFAPNSSHGRETSAEVVFKPRLRQALARLNPDVPPDVLEQAIEQFCADRSVLNPVIANREVHSTLKGGLPVTWRNKDGEECSDKVQFID